MNEATMQTVRNITLLVLIGSLVWRIWIMNTNTQKWNGLGYALRAENIAYALIWSWALTAPFWGPLQNPYLRIGIYLTLIAITIRVTLMLPRVVTSLREQGAVERVEHAADRTEEAAEKIETVAEELKENGQ